MYRLVEQGHVDGPLRQVGLRGYWPGEEEFAWQPEQGITRCSMRAGLERGIADVVGEGDRDGRAPGPRSSTIEVDVLDPAHAPGPQHPEPAGMTSADLLWACRELPEGSSWSAPTWSRRCRLSGLIPGDHRARRPAIALELLTGIALRRG